MLVFLGCNSMDINDDLSQPFPFETEHVALRGNTDYHKLLSTIALLEAQRTQAIHDVDKLLKVLEIEIGVSQFCQVFSFQYCYFILTRIIMLEYGWFNFCN